MWQVLRAFMGREWQLVGHGAHVVICGSMKHKEAMRQAAHAVLEAGHVPVLPIMTVNGDGEDLNRLHWEKIVDGDVVLVVNPDGRIGASTFSEITIARYHNRPVMLTNPVSDDSVGTTELTTWKLGIWALGPK